MNLIFVNYCHPETPHVCGLRMARFAQAMAERGHKVVLVTRDLEGKPVAPPAAALPGLLAAHSWQQPFLLAVPPVPSRFHRALHEGTLPSLIRKAVIAAAYLADGGLFGDWRRACLVYGPVLASHFRPDLAWGTFGNTDTWAVARGLARRAGIAWVMDIKDYWRHFIPRPFQGLLARRLGDGAHLTAFSGENARDAAAWFDQPSEVVYSGLPTAFLEQGGDAVADDFVLTLTGSVYDHAVLERFVAALAQWSRRRPAGTTRLVYAGIDHRAVAQAARTLEPSWRLDIHPYLPLDQLHRLHETATVNAYLRTDRGFHHKVIELLAGRRPVLSFPAEGPEAHQLAETCGGTLLSCDDEDALCLALDRVATKEPLPVATAAGLAAFTWASQAARLERVFLNVLESRR